MIFACSILFEPVFSFFFYSLSQSLTGVTIFLLWYKTRQFSFAFFSLYVSHSLLVNNFAPINSLSLFFRSLICPPIKVRWKNQLYKSSRYTNWKNQQIEEPTNGRTDKWNNQQMEEPANGRTNKWILFKCLKSQITLWFGKCEPISDLPYKYHGKPFDIKFTQDYLNGYYHK